MSPRCGWILVGSALACAASPAAGRHADALSTMQLHDTTLVVSRVGEVHVTTGPLGMRHAVVFISGDGGWDGTADRFARALAARGLGVIGLDIVRYRDGVRATRDSCVDFARDVRSLGSVVLSRLGRGARRRGELGVAGHSAGATAAYAAIAQGGRPPFVGGVSISFARELEFPVAPCARGALAASGTGIAGTYRLSPPSRPLSAPWLVLIGEEDDVVSPAESEAFARASPGARLATVPGAGHSLDASDSSRALMDAAARLLWRSGRPGPPRPRTAPATSLSLRTFGVSGR